ncbi:hypothetical protein CDD82_2574 [Ophiocordyceps australis]|uniref:Rhodopsin domain-containing protein n=1 Tax=Ophiocordyceps australis TaxID=1399860 RepID=A0A2C5ZB86_9HYPO|nr:hypothetical protein CDD82_2574 [Ophiocordyceps australis]
MDPSNQLNWTRIHEMANAMTPQERAAGEWRIRNGSKITMMGFKVAVGVLFAIASLAFAGRLTIRLMSRRRMLLDDLLLLASYLSLTITTAIFYTRARFIYLACAAMKKDDQVVSLIAAEQIAELYLETNWYMAYMVFVWTAIFMIKLCYLAFFHTLLRCMPRWILRFYWVSVVITIISWIFLSLGTLVTCPYFGRASSKCYPKNPVAEEALTFVFWISPSLDGLTDAAIVSIPIIVIRKSQMSLATKIGYCVFLCLSLFMLACSITRAAGTYYQNALDAPWHTFWLHAEACIGVLMASITVYRSLLTGSHTSPRGFRLFMDKLAKLRHHTDGQPGSKPLSARGRFGRFLLSKIPDAAFTGIYTMFDLAKSPEGTTTDTKFTMQGAELDYHSCLRGMEQGGRARAPSPPSASDSSTAKVSADESDTPKSEHQPCPPGGLTAKVLRFIRPPPLVPNVQDRSIGTGRDHGL